jgi:hypothetical protein
MSSSKLPPPRNLDIYRLVVVRGVKQCQVADWFSVTPVRICQIVGRVRGWVDSSIGEWLFPRRDDLRFYAALEAAQVRVHEVEHDAELVLLTGPGWTYRREVRRPVAQSVDHGQDGRATQATAADSSTSLTFPLSAEPLNSLPSDESIRLAASPSGASESAPPHVNELGRRLAELLIVWQKSRRLTGAFKSW